MPSKKKKKKPAKLYRWLFSLLFLALFYSLSESSSLEEISTGSPPVLYSSICSDNLETLYVDAIEGAKHSILLNIYSLSDPRIIEALNRRAAQGIAVNVMHDISTPLYGFKKLSKDIQVKGIKMSGLMHEKILVVDGERIWLGSANLTTESLKLHDNLVTGLIHPPLAKAIAEGRTNYQFRLNDQSIEFWRLPEAGKEGLKRLLELIASARKTIKVAMFTWTNLALTEAVIAAQKRGVEVEIILDRGQALGVCKATYDRFIKAGITPRLNTGLGLLHHKFAWIDGDLLINGSANWTVAAFKRNHDCFLILYPLTPDQRSKMEEVWKKTYRMAEEETCSEVAA